jgi:hypothetical protein
MNDPELIEKVAKLWIDLGGDAEGVEWCWHDLRDKVEELKEMRINETPTHTP